MPQPVPRADEAELFRRVRELEARVARLEQRWEPAPEPAASAAGAAPAPARTALTEGVGAVPVLGRALLGLAGAYALRAVAESHWMPQRAGVFAAILYAVAWLGWAAHLGRPPR